MAKAVRRKATPKAKVATVQQTPPSCLGGICSPRSVQGLRAPTVAKGTHELVSVKGPGVFLSARVTKQGGANGLTFVIFDIDGQPVVNFSYAAAKNVGLTQPNLSGSQICGANGTVENYVIGWPQPLVFKKSLRIAVKVNETGVIQIIANAVIGQSP